MGGWEESEQLIMGRLRIRTNPVQLGSAKAGTELGNEDLFLCLTFTNVIGSFAEAWAHLPASNHPYSMATIISMLRSKL